MILRILIFYNYFSLFSLLKSGYNNVHKYISTSTGINEVMNHNFGLYQKGFFVHKRRILVFRAQYLGLNLCIVIHRRFIIGCNKRY